MPKMILVESGLSRKSADIVASRLRSNGFKVFIRFDRLTNSYDVFRSKKSKFGETQE